jgi:LytS/YehU family sensor histidine kinase
MDSGSEAIVFLVIIGLIIGLIVTKQRSNKLKKELFTTQIQLKAKVEEVNRLTEENSKIEAELEAKKIENLKFVLNPHSVRNTLNTIRGLADRTFRSVIDLSGVFDFMLYESQQAEVTLEQEIIFATRYINLYVSGLEKRIRLDIDLTLEVDEAFTRGFRIAPLITAHFIENAFKHGDMTSDDAFFVAHLKQVGDHEIVFMVQNRMQPLGVAKPKGGLGKRKMEERLELLYKDRYHIEYKAENGKFTAQFKLLLNAI